MPALSLEAPNMTAGILVLAQKANMGDVPRSALDAGLLVEELLTDFTTPCRRGRWGHCESHAAGVALDLNIGKTVLVEMFSEQLKDVLGILSGKEAKSILQLAFPGSTVLLPSP
jgi:hypothetical protein